MIVDKMHVRQKLKYPKAVLFIVSNEFCERFSFYGIRTVLTLYLKNILSYSENTSTVIYHIFTMFVYFFPLFGAILADSWLGKFRTIFYVSIIYAIGQLLLTMSAAPTLVGLPPREFSLLGLLLIAIGTGGIKPCVSAFGGDQFILPQQERYLAMFFSLFYFSINSGSLISSFLTPWLRSNVKCLGATTCYSLTFLVPAILMILSIVIFVAGKPMYRIMQPTGNVIVKVSKCVSHAIYNKIKGKNGKRDHWLDHADDTYDRKLIDDIRVSLQVLKLFIPLPIFWALYDQQGSRWTFQATRMDGQIGSFLLEPDQMQVVNPLLILAFVPLFEVCIYPLFAKIHLIDTPLKKLATGTLLAALAFVVTGIVDLQLEKTFPVLPSTESAQLRIFNTLNCHVDLKFEDRKSVTVYPLSMWADLNVKVNGSITLPYIADFTKCYTNGYSHLQQDAEGSITVEEATASSWVITPDGLNYHYNDTVEKSRNGKPVVRALIYVAPSSTTNSVLKFVRKGETVNSISFNTSTFSHSNLQELYPNEYNIFLDNIQLQESVEFKLGGVYTVVGSNIGENKIFGRTIMVTPPNSMHMMWLLPQYIIITMAEVMFSVTGLQFAFTQAPKSMKSLLQAGWLLTVAFGNLIVVIISEVSIFDRQAYESFLYAGLMLVDMIIFSVMSLFYKYVKIPDEEDNNDDIALERKNGNINIAYNEDEK
ncbi:peptide transporter family 1-like isoform X2 [Odontomachus brunneus]|uniref:peptide transporter family 1-like isoform X2 n=1 Tax=Odontomachus brunneus TaxID=486640 RepID=UPI0013F20A8D|nr:peptide transporter family 1-like isoform X2 [Odontomachus brunneus]